MGPIEDASSRCGVDDWRRPGSDRRQSAGEFRACPIAQRPRSALGSSNRLPTFAGSGIRQFDSIGMPRTAPGRRIAGRRVAPARAHAPGFFASAAPATVSLLFFLRVQGCAGLVASRPASLRKCRSARQELSQCSASAVTSDSTGSISCGLPGIRDRLPLRHPNHSVEPKTQPVLPPFSVGGQRLPVLPAPQRRPRSRSKPHVRFGHDTKFPRS